jgi:glycerophosphoryl diester phosphodiesterase
VNTTKFKKEIILKIKNLGGIIFLIIVLFSTIPCSIAGDLMIIGHRGAAGLFPENTLAGFKKAMDIGVDAIEMDVCLTSDNEAVIYHDSRLNQAITRDPNGEWIKERRLIKTLTLSEVQSYDVGKLNRSDGYAKKYPDQKPEDGQSIPTLQEVIQLVKKTNDKTHLFIELKYSPLKPEETKSSEEISNVVAKIIKDENFKERVTVISFDWKTLNYFKGLMPEVPAGYVTIAKKDFNTIQKKKTGASPWMAGIDIDDFDSIPKAIKSAGGTYWITNYKHVIGHRKKLTSKMIEEAHSEGLKVVVWTPDSKSDMKKLIKLGVDGITTNRPDIALALMK